ncbi:hypothetical protein [Butyrivibrio sp. NC3005]|uniref:hypothetical protein n=1 Tax=Butyrivibrio sp. NC3005 TaxID=1280685 RepID=UPI00047EED84|nr:hypothetical protein [Butyrivibrio sp. NC3005]
MKSALKKLRIVKKINDFRWREHMTHPGKEDKDKVYYVIRRHDINAGLFSFACTNLASIRVCEQKGYIPVIDMQNSPNSMLTSDEYGKVNAWDQFFMQPEGVMLQDLSKKKNVILGEIHPPKLYPDYGMLESKEELDMWLSLSRKYLKLLPSHKEAAIEYKEKTFGDNKVLAIVARGTDYIKLKPHNHPIQPQQEDLINKAKEMMERHNCKYIYLATEDEKIWKRFKDEFPEKVYSYQQNHYEVPEGKYIADIANKIQTPYERNKEYLISIAVASMCNFLLAGASGGSYGAMFLSDGFEEQYIYKLGRY